MGADNFTVDTDVSARKSRGFRPRLRFHTRLAQRVPGGKPTMFRPFLPAWL